MRKRRNLWIILALLGSSFASAWADPPVLLPLPEHTQPFAKKLSLREAIFLALRNSPDVENAELQRVLDKFALETARYQFQPHYSIQGNAYYN